MGSVVKGVASLFGGRARRREQRSAKRALDGEQKTDYIEDILTDYYFVKSQSYPKPTIKKFYELFTKLVKKFGH